VSKSWKEERAIARDKTDTQNEILDEFGEEAVEKARKRLCAKCSLLVCSLLPLCLDGSDCPYFKLKEVND
jgi:hypothetical protein